jgi:hypothetical protein
MSDDMVERVAMLEAISLVRRELVPNVREEIRDEVSYALDLAEGALTTTDRRGEKG